MAGTIKQRLRRYNGTDYDTVHLETDGSVVDVELQEEFTNPLNTNQLTAGQHDVYFTAYPSIKWHVDHIDGSYVYLGLYDVTENTKFGSNTTYSGSTIAAKCTTFLNNTIPNVAQYLEDVTVEGVTNKVFIPTYYQMSGKTGYGDTSGPVFTYIANASDSTRKTIISNWSSINNYRVWLSTSYGGTGYVWTVHASGSFNYDATPSGGTCGFRPEVKVRYKDDPVIKDLNTALNDKQDKLTFDATPTEGSTNPVTSDGVKSYVDDFLQDIDASNVIVTEEFTNPLNTDQLALGQTGIYFTAYPNITWQVQHLDGDYAYLALAAMTETSEFGPRAVTSYSDSTIASKCTTFLNNTIPNVADCLEEVTVNGVTAKVFIPSYEQLSSEWDWPKAGASNRICQLNGSNQAYWTSTAFSSSYVWHVDNYGDFDCRDPTDTIGFRPAVKVRYKGIRTTTTDLNTVISDINSQIINGGTTPPIGKQSVNGLWFEDVN